MGKNLKISNVFLIFCFLIFGQSCFAPPLDELQKSERKLLELGENRDRLLTQIEEIKARQSLFDGSLEALKGLRSLQKKQFSPPPPPPPPSDEHKDLGDLEKNAGLGGISSSDSALLREFYRGDTEGNTAVFRAPSDYNPDPLNREKLTQAGFLKPIVPPNLSVDSHAEKVSSFDRAASGFVSFDVSKMPASFFKKLDTNPAAPAVPESFEAGQGGDLSARSFPVFHAPRSAAGLIPENFQRRQEPDQAPPEPVFRTTSAQRLPLPPEIAAQFEAYDARAAISEEHAQAYKEDNIPPPSGAKLERAVARRLEKNAKRAEILRNNQNGKK